MLGFIAFEELDSAFNAAFDAMVFGILGFCNGVELLFTPFGLTELVITGSEEETFPL